MVGSSARTIDDYLRSLPAERRAVVSTVRDVVRRNLPEGYSESMGYGMIVYSIPLATYPDTYNGQPLCYAAIAAQKHHYSLYLMCAYQAVQATEWLKSKFARAGKKLDMGKSCVRFKTLDALPLSSIGEFIARTTPDEFIAQYEASRAAPRTAPLVKRRTSAGKVAAKKSTTVTRRR